MNQSYKCIYNEQTDTWVAVSELTKAKGKKTSSLKTAVALASLAAVGSVNAATSIGPNGEFCQQAAPGSTWTCEVPNTTGGFATISGLPDIGAQPDYVALNAL